MNKAELIEALSAHYDGNKAEASRALNAVVQTITYQTASGQKVSITGFGVFEKVPRAARMVRNPRTGERKRAKATAVPRFRAGSDLKAYVSGAKKVAKTAAKKATPAAATKATAAKTTATKSPAKKVAAKSATRSAPAKKATTRSAAAKSTPAKKTTAKKTAAKSTPAKKSTARTTAAKSTPAKKTTAKKTATKTAKKTAKRS